MHVYIYIYIYIYIYLNLRIIHLVFESLKVLYTYYIYADNILTELLLNSKSNKIELDNCFCLEFFS